MAKKTDKLPGLKKSSLSLAERLIRLHVPARLGGKRRAASLKAGGKTGADEKQ